MRRRGPATAAGVATRRYLGSKLSWLSGRLLTGWPSVRTRPIPRLAARAGHRRGPYPRARWFDSIGCDHVLNDLVQPKDLGSMPSRSSPERRAGVDGYPGTDDAGATPAVVRSPPFQGWDTTLRRSLVGVRFPSVAPAGRVRCVTFVQYTAAQHLVRPPAGVAQPG